MVDVCLIISYKFMGLIEGYVRGLKKTRNSIILSLNPYRVWPAVFFSPKKESFLCLKQVLIVCQLLPIFQEWFPKLFQKEKRFNVASKPEYLLLPVCTQNNLRYFLATLAPKNCFFSHRFFIPIYTQR